MHEISKSELEQLLVKHGLWNQTEEQSSPVVDAIVRCVPPNGDQKMTIKAAVAFDRVLHQHNQSRLLLAQLCAHLQRLTGLKTSKIGMCLASASPHLVKSAGWVSRLTKAGNVLLNWPVLGDIESTDKLATLNRVPKNLQEQIFTSGLLPDGRSFRQLGKDELAAAVNALRSKKPMPVESAKHKAKSELVRLANVISEVADSLSTFPELNETLHKLEDWYAQLLLLLQDNGAFVRRPIIVHPTDGSCRAVPVGQASA